MTIDTDIIDAGNDLLERRSAAFVRARRHTRFVQVLRVVLPVLIVVISAGIIMSSGILTSRENDVQIGNVGIENGALTMENARLTGVDDEDRSYVVNAESASQPLTQPDVVDLTGIDAQISGDESGWAAVVAGTGQYDRNEEVLRLEQDVRVRTGDRYDVILDSAFVDLRNGSVVSDDPVEVQMMTGTVRASGMKIENKGETLRFYDGVSLNFTPNGAAPAASETPVDATDE